MNIQLSLFVRVDGQCQRIERARHECEYQLSECRGNAVGYKETIEDLETAIKALNEAEARLQGCDFCNNKGSETNYCPFCGKKLREEMKDETTNTD